MKNYPTLGLCQIIKFCSTFENRTPQTLGLPPQPKNPACPTAQKSTIVEIIGWEAKVAYCQFVFVSSLEPTQKEAKLSWCLSAQISHLLKKLYILFKAQSPLIAQSPIVARCFRCFDKIVAQSTKRVVCYGSNSIRAGVPN